jgi:hypothetical protein
MKRNFTHENLEDFLRQSADSLYMRPTGKVWKQISKKLNARRRRIGYSLVTLLLALSMVGYFLIETPSTRKTTTAASANTTAKNTSKTVEKNISEASTTQASNSHAKAPLLQTSERSFTNSTAPTSLAIENAEVLAIDKNVLLASTEFKPTIVDSYFDLPVAEENSVTTLQQSIDKLPLTIESVINSYKPTTSKKKLRLQIYFTPTVSYRKLGENKSFLRSQPANNPNYAPAFIYDVNNVVTHKPDMGFEIGAALKYPLTQKLRLRGGLQLNLNRYDIKAYNSIASVATIMLNGRSSSRDSLNTISSYSTNGYAPDWLQNFYLQISAPVGVEVDLFDNKKVQFGIATTVQPTYVLGDRAYLISTDYKNYSEVPQLVRRWNVNTALETYVGYSTGKLSWQVGPQVRYQLLSSFVNKYPVKENLFDFGLKVGVTLNKD